MSVPPRSAPTPRARRILDEILSLTVVDVVWMRDEMSRLLGGEGGEATGVREPRRPNPPSPLAAVREILDDLDADNISEDTAIARLRVVTNPLKPRVDEAGLTWLHGDSSIPGPFPADERPWPIPRMEEIGGG